MEECLQHLTPIPAHRGCKQAAQNLVVGDRYANVKLVIPDFFRHTGPPCRTRSHPYRSSSAPGQKVTSAVSRNHSLPRWRGGRIAPSRRSRILCRAPLRASSSLKTVYGIFPKLLERSSQDATTVSGGEQQMCAIDRGLMAAPQLLMIDALSLGPSPPHGPRNRGGVTPRQ